MLGEQDGKCETVYVNEGDRIQSLVIYHDEHLIRLLEFRMASGRSQEVGFWSGLLFDLDQ